MWARAKLNIRCVFNVAAHAHHVVINSVRDAVFKRSADISFLSRAFLCAGWTLVFCVCFSFLTDGFKRLRLCAFQLCQKRRAVVDQVSRHCASPSILPTPHKS